MAQDHQLQPYFVDSKSVEYEPGRRQLVVAKAVRFASLPLVMALLLLATTAAFAQQLNGELRGTVLDPEGKPVANAAVSVANEATNVSLTTETSAVGTYAFPVLPVGSYTLHVNVSGFAAYQRTGIQVRAAEVTGASPNLAIAGVSTQVQVASGADLLQTESSQLGASFDGAALVDIPTATGANLSVLNLSILLPNTTSQPGGVLGDGGSVGGLRARQNSFTIDGIDNNDPDVTGVSQPVIPDAVQEFVVNQNVFSAEYGRGSGGQFNVITKTGTNQLHLGAWLYNGNRAYDAADNQEIEDIAGGVRSGKRRYDFNRVGGEVGGPILRDNLFFYGAYEFNNLGEPAIAATALAPTSAGLATLNTLAVDSAVRNLLAQFPTAPLQTGSVTVFNRQGSTPVPVQIPVGNVNSTAPSYDNDQQYLLNFDWHLGRHNLQLRSLNDRNRQPFYGSFPQTQFASLGAIDSHRVTLHDAWTVSPHFVNELQGSFSRYSQYFPLSGVAQAFPSTFILDLSSILIGPSIAPSLPESSVYNEYLLGDTATWIVKQRHTVKFGGQFYWFTAPLELLNLQRGEYAYFTLDSLINDQVPGEAFQGAGNGFFSGNSKNFNLFVQDDIKVTSRLIVNAGLRYDFFGNPAGEQANALNSIANLPGTPLQFGVPKSDTNNFGPRLGLAWDPTGSGKWAVRAGGGIVYDWIPWNFAQNSLPVESQANLQVLNLGSPPFTSSGVCQGSFGPPPAWCTNGGTGFLANGGLNINFVPPSTTAAARAQTSQLMANAQAPKVFTWSLSVQHALFRNSSVEIRYLGTRALELPVQLQLNSITPFDLGAQPLPTFIHASSLPASLPVTAPTLAQFLSLETERYAAQGFTGGPLTIAAPVGASTYHGGSVEFLHHFDHGLLLRANYTYSKTMDDATNELASSTVDPRRPQDSYNLQNEWALSALDVPHKVTISFVYDTPRVNWGGRVGAAVLNGWEWSGTYLFQSGQPVTIQSGVDSNGNLDSASDRAILNPNGAEGTGSLVNRVCRTAPGSTSLTITANSNTACSPSLTVGYVADGPGGLAAGINPNAKYIQAGAGAQANLGRDTYRSPALNTWNMAIMRTAKLGERVSLQFRAEAYDVFNHPNFTIGTPTVFPSAGPSDPANSAYASLTSVPGGTFLNPNIFNSGSRHIQFSLRIRY